jgi:hypothetical protein
MAFRKNKKFIDPRYFMDEKTEIIKEEFENLIEADEAWVLRKSGATDAGSFLQPTPALTQKKGESKWGPKQSARTFKGDNGKARATDEQKKLKKNGITVSIEKK